MSLLVSDHIWKRVTIWSSPWERRFFILLRAWHKETILSPHEESSPRPSDSALRCSNPWATETLRWARSITNFVWHASCILLGSAMSKAWCYLKHYAFDIADPSGTQDACKPRLVRQTVLHMPLLTHFPMTPSALSEWAFEVVRLCLHNLR